MSDNKVSLIMSEEYKIEELSLDALESCCAQNGWKLPRFSDIGALRAGECEKFAYGLISSKNGDIYTILWGERHYWNNSTVFLGLTRIVDERTLYYLCHQEAMRAHQRAGRIDWRIPDVKQPTLDSAAISFPPEILEKLHKVFGL